MYDEMIRKSVKYILNSDLLARQVLKSDPESENKMYYVYVDPKKITHISLITEGSPSISGPKAVTGSYSGLFDYLKFPFDKHFMHHTVKMMLNGSSWKSTPFYKKLIKIDSEEDAIVHLQKLDNLIQTLSQDGYLSQYELGNLDIQRNLAGLNVPKHETLIGLDRSGNLFRLKGGRHRLAVAQNIGITEMPAILSLYHKKSEHLLPKKRRLITGDPEDFRPFTS